MQFTDDNKIRYFRINQAALEDMMELLECGYHVAACEDNRDYLTIIITDDDGNKPEEKINDCIFDLEIVEDD